MVRPMFGVESEFSLAGIRGNEPMRRDELVNRFLSVARRRLTYLPDTCSPSGMFLENAARLYIDCGLHPEMTTPECTTPWELARYIKAGERILEMLTQEVQDGAGASAEVMCYRCNVDYSGSGCTWGCHESYLHRTAPSSLPEQLIPHLVTRVIYTGAGGFDPRTRQLEFRVAPRLLYIQNAVSSESTHDRGIFHTKNEPLAADGYNRLHILCGESLCSERAIVLKTGATALVTAMAEAGLKPGAGLRLADPLEALYTVASDITCKKKLPLAGGGEAGAIEIQRRLLRLADRNRDVLPPWADAIRALWRRTLDELEGAPDSVAASLDWAIKLRLFEDRAERRGFTEQRIAFLNSILRRLNSALAAAGVNGTEIGLRAVVAPGGPIPEETERCVSLLTAEGLAWDDLNRFLIMRNEFYQIDTRFGQLGPRGIFGELDRRGVLDHKVAAVDGVEEATREPPAVGRAKLRGEMVRRFHGQGRAACDWMSVHTPDGRRLDLSDPFASAELWVEPASPPLDFADVPPESMAEGLADDSVGLQQMFAAMRRRYVRSRTRASGAPETTESPNR